MLTAAHVVGSLSGAHSIPRTDVYAVAKNGVPGSGDPLIGHVERSRPDAPNEPVDLDVSVVALVDGVTAQDVVRNVAISGVARDVEATSDRDDPVIVYKRGINTGLTRGLLNPYSEDLTTRSPQPDGGTAVWTYPRGFFVYGDDEPFAKPGDSGSIVIDGDDCVVGLLVAMLADHTGFVIPIVDILTSLQVELAGPQRLCTLV